MEYSLTKVKYNDQDIISTFYEWEKNENHRERYTCRPLKQFGSYESYLDNFAKKLSSGERTVFVLTTTINKAIPIGRIMAFDFNMRNHSCEFGYYMPVENRGQGLGTKMVQMFVHEMFTNQDIFLNKIYATTASNNIPSIALLQNIGFSLDGRMREHYWFKQGVYDQLVFSLLRAEWANTPE